MLGEALVEKGYQITVLGNRFAGDLFATPFQEAFGTAVIRCFDTGFCQEYRQFDLDKMKQTIVEQRSRILLINYQDYLFPDKQGLNELVDFLVDRGGRAYAIVHDTCLSSEVCWTQITRIVPPTLASIIPGIEIDQGIPEFFELPEANLVDFWRIASMGLGRNRLEALLRITRELNAEGSLARPIRMIAFVPRTTQQAEYEEYKKRFSHLTTYPGYHPRYELASMLHNCNAAAIWYPEITDCANSSAFRFCIGSKVPIVSTKTNWIKDYQTTGTFMSVDADSEESWKITLRKLFGTESNYSFYREMISRHQEAAVQEKGWSQIADQYDRVFQDSPEIP